MKEKRNLLFKGKNGTTNQIIVSGIEKAKDPRTPEKPKRSKKEKRSLRDSFKSGRCRTPDLFDLSIGLETADLVINSKLNTMKNNMLTGKEEIKNIKVGLAMSDRVISHVLAMIGRRAETEYSWQKTFEELSEMADISQAARDGLILKKQEVTENGKKKIYDVPMSEREATQLFDTYTRTFQRIRRTRLLDYAKIGTSVFSTIGMITKKGESSIDTTKSSKLVSAGSIVTGIILLSRRLVPEEDERAYYDYRDKANSNYNNLIYNEQVSSKAIEKKVESYKKNIKAANKQKDKYDTKMDMIMLASKISTLIFSGMFVAKSVKNSENQKLNSKLLSEVLVSLVSYKGIAGQLVDVLEDIFNSRETYKELDELQEKILDIERQMEEKVYCLEGAKEGFDSFKIENLDGKFYPIRDYETGKITYGTHIKVPEFSMKKGDIVLLSGESGVGKSTFLRLLKRGDVNNRKSIELGNGERVDNFGQECISFRPSINLGNETSVLEEITGKEKISDLTEDEKEHLKKIMNYLELSSDDILEQLAKRKFMQFSTGQQRRLALSKVFYDTEKETSILIVDEPVGNVEDRLVREQLKLIKGLAEKNNVMLILVTHRIDLVEDLINKRYHISKDGVMEQIPIEKEKDDVDIKEK